MALPTTSYSDETEPTTTWTSQYLIDAYVDDDYVEEDYVDDSRYWITTDWTDE